MSVAYMFCQRSSLEHIIDGSFCFNCTTKNLFGLFKICFNQDLLTKPARYMGVVYMIIHSIIKCLIFNRETVTIPKIGLF